MGSFVHKTSGNTHIVAAAGGIEMVMLVRDRKEFFTAFIEREVAARKLKAVINGSFVNLGKLASLSVVMGSSPLDPAESSAVGEVIQDGHIVAGSSSSGKFHFSQNTCGADRFTTGLGDPPVSSCAAVGGIAPIVSDGLAYGSINRYRSGVPMGAPATGNVDAKYLPFLTQKSNLMFSDLLNRGASVGKTAIGFSSKSKALIMLVQEDGTNGLNANEIRSVFVANSVENAVFLDCSDSATLYYDGKFLVNPGKNKNEFLTIAVGFK